MQTVLTRRGAEFGALMGVMVVGGLLASAPARATDVAVWVDTGIVPLAAERVVTELAAGGTFYPVLFKLGAAGPERVPSEAVDQLVRRAAELGRPILPTIQNLGEVGFDPELVRPHLVDESSRRAFARQLAALVDEAPFSGLNLDFEGLGEADRDAMTAFMGALREELAAGGRQLSVCLPARTEAEPGWDGARWVDWTQLAQVVDEGVVMAYDYHWPGGDPGPVAPLGWVEAVAGFALSHLPAAQLRMGLPLYGYDWGPQGTEPVAMFQLEQLERRRDVVWPGKAPAQVHGFEVGAVRWAHYKRPGGLHRVVVEPPAATHQKIAALAALGVEQVAFWRAGFAPNGLLAEVAAGSVPGAPPTPKTIDTAPRAPAPTTEESDAEQPSPGRSGPSGRPVGAAVPR